MKATELTMTIQCSTWRMRWSLRALRLAIRIAPAQPRLVKAFRRAVVSAINRGVRLRVNDDKWFRPSRPLVTESIFE